MARDLSWTRNAWNEYLYRQNTDKKVMKKINALVDEIIRHPFEGSGKPEALKGELSGLWSRRIDEEHRLVYKATDSEIRIFQCRYHYSK
jgi:toxin YoeB